MSWSSRRALLALPLLALVGGCGFHPLYSQQEQEVLDPDLAAITVLPIADRDGQKLEFLLREQLNPDALAVKPRYVLQVVLRAQRLDLGLQRDATSVRGRIDSSATMTLSSLDTHKQVYTSTAQSSSDFTILEDAYAAQVGEDAARERAVRDLGDQICLRLALFLRQQRASAAD
jgi:LPS-assembly lipoprotein